MRPSTVSAYLIEELAAKTGTDIDGARQALMDTLSGIPIGRPAWLKEVAVAWGSGCCPDPALVQ